VRAPKRVQIRRDVAWQDRDNPAVKVDRSTKWGNPSRVQHSGDERTARQWAVDFFVGYVTTMQGAGHYVHGSPHGTNLDELRGRDLACWCKPTDPCHADYLLEIANAPRRLFQDHGEDLLEM